MANKSWFLILYKMARDFLSIITTDIDVEWLFNSAQDIYYFCWGQLDKNTIFTLMLQLMTDCCMIKEEFCQQREESEEDIINDEHNKEEAEELFQYISDISKGEESDDDYAGVQDRMLTIYQLPLYGDPIRWSNSLDVTVYWQVETASILSDPLTCWSMLHYRMMRTSV